MIKKLYEIAGRLQSAEHEAKEVDKKGVLRGGTTGCVEADGTVVGQCHRKALIRYLGLQAPAGPNLWFDMGFANEELWTAKIRKAWPHGIKCEEDFPIQWELDGVTITGRPDIVLMNADDQPVAGIELKSVGSVNTALNIWFENKPKTENLLQAAHYASQVGVPFYLVYTFLSKAPLPYWAQKKFAAKDLSPFIKEFKVWLDGSGAIHYTTEDGVDHPTPLSLDGIKDFYRLVIDMDKRKDLYTRFTDRELNGDPLPFEKCKYCAYNDICNNYDHNYDLWLDHVQQIKDEGAES
jgi:hypothetical protein